MTTPGCVGVYNEDLRVAQLIQRDADGNDVIVLDILGNEHEGHQGIVFGKGMKGLHHLAFTKPRQKGAFTEGSLPSPFPRVDERLPQIKLITSGRTLAIRDQIDGLLWRVVHRRKTCYLRVWNATRTSWRELAVTLAETVDDSMDYIGGSEENSHEWTVQLVAAEQPYWTSELIEHTLKRSDMVQQPDGSWLGYIPVENPANNDGWLEWANGTATTTEQWSIPDGDAVYSTKNAPTPADVGKPIMHQLPPLGPGKEFLVLTYPTSPTLQVRDRGQDWARLRGFWFDYPLDPETPWQRKLPVKLIGGSPTSTISVFLTPRWDSPYGGEVA